MTDDEKAILGLVGIALVIVIWALLVEHGYLPFPF